MKLQLLMLAELGGGMKMIAEPAHNPVCCLFGVRLPAGKRSQAGVGGSSHPDVTPIEENSRRIQSEQFANGSFADVAGRNTSD